MCFSHNTWFRYKFDTHYPDYFPPRGDGREFAEVVKELREKHGVFTVPYINGRILDVHSDSYAHDDGAVYCSKSLKDQKLLRDAAEPGAITFMVSSVTTSSLTTSSSLLI